MTAGVETEVIEILVTGLPQTGKTTFMRTISTHTAMGQDGWHQGYLPVDEGLDVHFLEPPPTRDFDFMFLREIILEFDLPGYIVLCDSTKPELFGEMIGILQTVYAEHPDMPIVLVANKQDQPDAWTADDIRLGLGIPDEILVIPCIAQDVESVKETVLQLLYQILG